MMARDGNTKLTGARCLYFDPDGKVYDAEFLNVGPNGEQAFLRHDWRPQAPAETPVEMLRRWVGL
jgi:hypothetical protein